MTAQLGTLGIGDLAASLLSLRFGGTALTRAELADVPVTHRKTGMVCCVLEDGSLWIFDEAGVEGIVPAAGSGTWRPMRTQEMLYSKSWSMLAAALVDADGHVTSIATKTTADNLTGAELTGAVVTANVGLGPKTGMSFWPTATLSSTVGAFVAASVITWTGTYNGAAITRTATIASADGNATLFASGPMDSVTSIDIAAQADTDGTFTFGFSGVSPGLNAVGAYKPWKVVSYADAANADTAALVVGYSDGSIDTVELPKGGELFASPVRIYGTTTAPITIYE